MFRQVEAWAAPKPGVKHLTPKWPELASLLSGVLLMVVAVFLVGCVGEGSIAGNEPPGPDVTPLEVEAPLRAPVFDPDQTSVFALDEEARQLVRLEVEETSGGFESSGEPLAVTEERGLEGPWRT